MKKEIAGLISKHVGIEKKEVLGMIELPSSEYGDYALPCFFLAKKFKKNPIEIAKELAEKIKRELPKEIEKVEVVNAYINFFVNKKTFSETIIKKILEKGEEYGSSNIGKGKKALIEHTSINPNASPHVGRSRNAFIGDVLARLLRFQDHKTEVHYYVNDVSKQVALLTLGCKGNESFEEMLDIYVKMSKKMEQNAEIEKKIFLILEKLEKRERKTTEKIRKIIKTCVKGQENIFSKLDIKYDFFDYESEYLRGNKLGEIINRLKKTGKIFSDGEGRLILNQEGFELEKEMKSPVLVLARSDGTGLYVLRDIAYTMDKMEKAEKNVIVLGEDHKLYFKQLKAALYLLNCKAPEAIHYSFVLIKTEQGKKKMSTRRGELVLLEDFMKEAVEKAKKEIEKRKTKGNAEAIAFSAIKYAILKINPEKNVIFDWKEALNFEGDSGPYLQYAYVRASSILRKAGERGEIVFDYAIAREEHELIKHLSFFGKTCEDALSKFDPSIIANYAYELAKKFSYFYENCPVINAEPKIKRARIALVEATKQVLENVLSLLGIKTLEEM